MGSHDLTVGADDSRVRRERRDNARRDVAVVGLRDAGDRLLLVRTRRFPDQWQPIGGGIDSADASPVEALVREVEEELALRLRERDFRLVVRAPYDFGEGTVHFYEARIGHLVSRISFNRREILGHLWVRLDETDGLPMFPATQAFLKALNSSDDAR
jgi:8-oxo-dGTP pyrophosphatase MutT (NUDIX family)